MSVTKHLHYAIEATPFGDALIALVHEQLRFIEMGSKADLRRSIELRFPSSQLVDGFQEQNLVKFTLSYLCQAKVADANFPLPNHGGLGTPFQNEVWEALRQIRMGETITYGQLAKRLGRPKAFRAVANACNANPFPILNPCHRVIRSDGHFGGYRWGAEVKRKLILFEQSQTQKMLFSGF